MNDLALPTATITTATPLADWVIVLPVVLCLVGAALAVVLRRHGRWQFALTFTVLVAVLTCAGSLLWQVLERGPISMTMGKWLPPFGISLTADIVGAAFALTAALITLLVVVYRRGQPPGPQGSDDFHALVLLLLAGVTGAFLTGDLFNLYVWFEVMLIASFGLLVLGGQPIQLDAAIKYGFLNFLATSFFLLALGLLYGLLGTLNMADIMRVAPQANAAALTGVAALLMLAFAIKAAAFPVNAWLPASYHAPSVVVSALFAGLLTKVGAYALLRSLVVILPASSDLLEPVLVTLAVGTLLVAPLGAIAETNLRRAIGFLVIGGIGAVLAGLAMPTLAGVSGAATYIFHAMLTMTALYLVAGLIEQRTGQVDTRLMGGIYAVSAPLSLLFGLVLLATAGVPPLLGFWPKLLLLQAGFGEGDWVGGLLATALLVNAVLTLIAGSRLWAHIFWRDAPAPAAQQRQGGVTLVATCLIVGLIVAIGLWPNPLLEAMNRGAADMLESSRYSAAFGLAGDS